jgi:hypothetical protein
MNSFNKLGPVLIVLALICAVLSLVLDQRAPSTFLPRVLFILFFVLFLLGLLCPLDQVRRLPDVVPSTGELIGASDAEISRGEQIVARIGERGHGTHGGPGWASGDWKELKCLAVGCTYNRAEECMVPTRCEILSDGRCKGFEAAAMPKQISGD